MNRAELQRHIEERVNFVQRELATFMGHVYRKDKASAQSSLKAMHIYIDSLERLVSTLPDAPNVRPGYSYDSFRLPN